jgi:hypothetical protein
MAGCHRKFRGSEKKAKGSVPLLLFLIPLRSKSGDSLRAISLLLLFLLMILMWYALPDEIGDGGWVGSKRE